MRQQMVGYVSFDERWGETAIFANEEEAVQTAMSLWNLSQKEAEGFVEETAENLSAEVVGEVCPWEAVIAKVDGGFIAFESVDDFKVWKNQL